MLYIEHLTKTFGEKKAVDDLSLHIAPGEIYGFIGHNGAGKTTTLKSVVGIQQFDSGRITIGGHSIQDDPIACKKMLAYIPDNPDLYEFMTGIQYLNFIADIFGVEESARQERIRKYADLFELTADLAQPVAAYSHGMKQKLEFYRRHLRCGGKRAAGAYPQVCRPLRADGRPGPARRGVLPRHEAEACHHFGVAARAEAHFDG